MDNTIINDAVTSTITELLQLGILKTCDPDIVKNWINNKYPKPFYSAHEYNLYMESELWRKEREKQLEIHGRKCEICGSQGPGLNVHHITYERGTRPDDDDFAVLCPDCHKKVHDIVYYAWEGDYTSYLKTLREWQEKAKRDLGERMAIHMNNEWPAGIPGRNKMRAACIVRDTLMSQHNLQLLNPRHDAIMQNLIKQPK